MLLLCNYYVRMHELIFISYSSELLLCVTAKQEHTVSVVLPIIQCWFSVVP